MKIKKILLAIFCVLMTIMSWAQAPYNTGNYYKNADGKKGSELKSALCTIIRPHKTLGYSNLKDYYPKTDIREGNYLWDIYGNIQNYTVSSAGSGKMGAGWNKEHSVPQSWFDGASPMYSDIMHLFPVDSWWNTIRSNLPYGETDKPDQATMGGFCKRGPCKESIGYSGTIFEPNDEFKGDLARVYFYMVTCYEAEIKVKSWSGGMFQPGAYPAFKQWAENMLMRWAREDPVSPKEIARNNAIYGDDVQGNRNPFVDYPGLEEYIWGDMTDVAFSYDNYQEPTATTVAMPLISPPTGLYTSEQEVTITCRTKDADIYYTTDGTDPTVVSDLYIGPFTITKTTTVKALAISNGEASPIAVSVISISESGQPVEGDGIYTHVTSADQLETGRNYLIVNIDAGKAYSGFNGNGGSAGNVNIVNDQIDLGDLTNNATPLYLESSGSNWLIRETLESGTDMYLALTESKNGLSHQSNPSDQGTTWKIYFDNGVTYINNVDRSSYFLQYNKTSPMWRCYTGKQQNPSLFKENASKSEDTGIRIIQSVDSADGSRLDYTKPMYNLNGQRVGAGYKGIVIQNGKRIVVR